MNMQTLADLNGSDQQPESYVAGLLNRLTNRILSLESLDLQEILATTAAEVRSFLGTDRVKIYKFHPDGNGQVIAESVQENRLPSLMGLNFPADDIPPYARELFVKARMRSVVDVTNGQIGQGVLHDPTTGEVISEEIRYRPIDPCHQEYLTAMGVQSSLAVPILHRDHLWGLLVAHHSEPWSASEAVLQSVQMVVDQLAVAIAQSSLLIAAQEKANREATINHISGLLHSLSTIDLSAALASTVQALKGSGGRLYIRTSPLNASDQAAEASNQPSGHTLARTDEFKVYTCGTQPVIPEGFPFSVLEQYSAWDRYFQASDKAIWSIADLYRTPEVRNLQPAFRATSIRGILIVPLRYNQRLMGYLSIFRDEIATETLWAGQFDPDQRQIQPRLSFEVWKESKQGQAVEWTSDEIDFLKVLGLEFANAIHQYWMHLQLQGLNTDLEQQVQERTAKLQQALEELQLTQTQLIQAEKTSSLGQLVAGIAHEVNNPINFIYGNLTHAGEHAEDILDLLQLYQKHSSHLSSEIQAQAQAVDIDFIAEDLPKILTSMKTGADRIRQVVTSLLNFSRLDQAELKTVDIHEGIDSTLLILHHRLRVKSDSPGIEVVKEYGDLPAVECYAGELNQAFMNVLNNAIDAIEQQWQHTTARQPGHIKISTSKGQTEQGVPTVVIRVADNGPGISEVLQAQVFNPFFTTKPSSKGTGLGLSITQQIVVNKHRGVLQFTSEPGRGTEFWIEIPTQQTGI